MREMNLRNFPRLPLHYQVEYSVLSGAGELGVLAARSLDFSVSGARIETERGLTTGDTLSVRLEVPDLLAYELDTSGKRKHKTTVVMCFGEVRWVGRDEAKGVFTAGVRFRNMSVVERAYLSELLVEDAAGAVKEN